MGKNKQSPSLTKDCTPYCKSKLHASELIAAMTLTTETISDIELASYISSKCYRFSKIQNENEQTLLHMAASTGRRDLCKYLLEHNRASIFAQEYTSGYTPLHCSLYFGFINVAVFLIQNESDLSLLDKNGLTPIDQIVRTPLSTAKILRANTFSNENESTFRRKTSDDEDAVDVSVWGINTNYTIGLSSGQKSVEPKILEIFRNERIIEVCMQTYHTLFLDDKGRVWSCGLGTGGRLGQNSEEVTVLPQKINMDDPKIVFTKIAAGDHHSIFLTDKGKVYTCGLNKYHQLGIERNTCNVYPAYVSIPTAVKSFDHEGEEICGVCASNVHSAVWTANCMYTCGLNVGQLGKVGGIESKYFKRTFINKFPGSIHEVVTNKTTTVVTTTHDEIIIINNGLIRCINNLVLLSDSNYLSKGEESFFNSNALPSYKTYLRAKSINRPFRSNIIQIQAIGGHQKIRHTPELSMSDMLIVILLNNGQVYVYKENYEGVHRCLLMSSYNIFVTHISVNCNNAFLTSEEGEVYKATFGDLVDWYRTKLHEDDGFKVVGSSNTSTPMHEKCMVQLEKIPNVYRALSIYSDIKGNNFCLIQKRSNGKIKTKPKPSSSNLVDDLRNLLLSASENDEFHDVVYVVEGGKFAAHKFIVATTCHELTILPVSTDGYVHINKTHPLIFRQLLLYIYTGDCDLLNIGPCHIKIPAENRKKIVTFENPIKLLGALAKSFNIKSLIDLLGNLRYNSEQCAIEAIRIELYYFDIPEIPKLNRKSFQLLYDIGLKTPDGSVLMAHKCVLVARLEYFRTMFSGCWRESKMGNAELQLNFPYNVLRNVINFLYTDKLLIPNDGESKDLTFWIGLFAASSELLIPNLFELCEISLVDYIDVRNIGNMMQLAYMHSAQQLLEATFQFAYFNLPTILSSRIFEKIDEMVLDEFSKYYRQKVTSENPLIPTILPYESAPSVRQIKEIAAQFPVSWDDEPDDVLDNVEEVKDKKKKKKKRGKKPPLNVLECTGHQTGCQTNNEPVDEKKVNDTWKEVKTKPLKTGLKIATAIRENPELLIEQEEYTSFSLKKDDSPFEEENTSRKSSPMLLKIDCKNITPKISQGQRKRLKSFKKNEKKMEESDNEDEEEEKECNKSVWKMEGNSNSNNNNNNNDLCTCLADIMNSEKKQKKRQSPIQFNVFVADDLLPLTQIEEKAIQQLSIFYNVGNVDDEMVTVERVIGKRNYAAPTWIRHTP